MSQIPPTPRRPGPSRLFLVLAVAVALAGLVLWLDRRYPDTLGSEDGMLEAARLGALLLLVASGVLASRRLRLANAVRDLALWTAILAGLVALYGFRAEIGMVGSRVMGELEPHRAIGTEGGQVAFRRGPDGHFHVRAEANGQPVMFLVDTGASSIVLSPEDARRAGLDLAALTYNRRFRTANGDVFGASATLDSLSIGPIRLSGVEVSVNGAAMSESLLGMSFLDRLSGYEVRGDTLILRP